MNPHRPLSVVLGLLIATQMFGPSLLWAADQRGILTEANRRVVVSSLSGDQVTAQNGDATKALHFRDPVRVGDQLATGKDTMAEVLVGNRAVVILDHNSVVHFTTVSDKQTTIQVRKGIVRIAAAASALGEQGMVTVQTPTMQVQTRGGIVRVIVEAPAGAAEQPPVGEAKPYLASYAPGTLIAATKAPGEVIQVEEGIAEIPGAGPGGRALTVQAGQSVKIQSGQAGAIAGLFAQDSLRTRVVATTGHSNTPKEGLDNLVALQVGQATALGTALTGAAETGKGQMGPKDNLKNVINGATGGVTSQTQQTQGVLAKTFGDGGFFSGTGGNAVNTSGSAVLDDVSNDTNRVREVLEPINVPVKGKAGLLLFTERPNPGKFEDGEDRPKLSRFTASKELLLVDGGAKDLAPHGGNAPSSTLVARTIESSNVGLQLTFDDISSDDAEAIAKAKVALVKAAGDERKVLENRMVDLDLNGNPVLTNVECDVAGFTCYATGESALSDFSNRPDGISYIGVTSFVDGVISGRSAMTGNRLVTLRGGVVLDRETTVRLGETAATNAYFTKKSGVIGPTFNGSLLSVLASQDGGFKPAFVKIQDRALGVLDGSSITRSGDNKVALLSVLDSRLIGPDANDSSTGTNGRKPGEIAPLMEMDGVLANGTLGARPSATVTSAIVVRATDVPLDGALLSASSPLLAMMHASMKTESHFADLAGNNGRLALLASLVPGDALVRLNNAALTINGNLLNLHNATAAVTGYLFSLNNSSTLHIDGGTLFSLNNESSLTLNANAFGVFGSGSNTLKIENNWCGAGAVCGLLVNSANQAITLLDGTPLKVSGVTQDVMLPNNFNAFALAPGATAINGDIGIDANDALFHVDGTSTLTINGTTIVGQ